MPRISEVEEANGREGYFLSLVVRQKKQYTVQVAARSALSDCRAHRTTAGYFL